MHNIIEGFRVNGVYPFDRHVVVPRKPKRASLAERTGLKFIPLCSPSRKQPDNTSAMVPRFSPEEIARFQVRFEEEYDLPDERYRQWVRMYHPESPPLREHDSSSPPADPESPASQLHPIPLSEDENRTLPHSTFLSCLLSERVPQVKYPSPVHKSSGRVLTSSENLLRLEEKRKEKEAAAEEKQRRKEEREQPPLGHHGEQGVL